jgi:hypothetical protein
VLRRYYIYCETEVKQKLYTHSVGSWTKYKHQLQPMIEELKKHLPKLKKSGALPYADKMNWALDPGFDYEVMRRQVDAGV